MNSRILKTAFRAGLLGGAIFCVYLVIAYGMYEYPFLPQIKSLDFFIYLLTSFASLSYYRFRLNQGRLSFKEGFTLSALSGLITLGIALLFLVIFTGLIAPDTLDKQAQYEISQFKKAKENLVQSFERDGRDGELIYQQTLENYQKRNWLAYLIIQELWQKAFLIIFLTFILALVLRK